MTAAQNHPTVIVNREEITAVNLADDYAEEATASLGLAKSGDGGPKATVAALCAMTDALLAVGARIDALRETLNRELPYVTAAIDELTKD